MREDELLSLDEIIVGDLAEKDVAHRSAVIIVVT